MADMAISKIPISVDKKTGCHRATMVWHTSQLPKPFGHGNQVPKMKSSIMFNVKLQTSNVFKHLNGGLSPFFNYTCIMMYHDHHEISHEFPSKIMTSHDISRICLIFRSWSTQWNWRITTRLQLGKNGDMSICHWAIFLGGETMAKIWVTLWSYGFCCLILPSGKLT